VREPYVPAETALKVGAIYQPSVEGFGLFRIGFMKAPLLVGSLQVYRRYLQLEPGHAEEYIEFLKARGHWNEAAIKLADLVNDDR
jgi:hypothetical protein